VDEIARRFRNWVEIFESARSIGKGSAGGFMNSAVTV
jgi:hypothetical protein